MADYPDIKLFIDGEWRERAGQPILNPADESVLGDVPHATRGDLDDAVSGAVRGFATWRRTSPADRAVILHKAADLIRQRVEMIAVAMTMEQGKPLAQSHAEVARAADIMDWDAEEGRRTYGRVIPAATGMRNIVYRQPVGVVAAFSPWNFPISSPCRKVAGALAAGCSIILKPSEETPAGAQFLVQALVDAGVPGGVVNMVFGNPAEVSSCLIKAPEVRLVTFTGSVPVGKHLSALAGEHMKPVIMELGGHSPVIVAADADPVASAKVSVLGKSRNSGQVCVSPTRFFVEDAVYDQFVDTFVKEARHLRMGPGLDPATQFGPLANARRIEAMEGMVADAKARGARVLAGGGRTSNNGYYFPLTVLADLPDEANAMRHEPFGPLALINRVPDVDTAIRKANSLPYGLAGYAFTRSAATVALLSDELEVGNLAINHLTASFAETPFGGVKDSGYGREGGTEGLEGYTIAKSVSHMI